MNQHDTPAKVASTDGLGAWVPCAEKMPPPDGRYLVWFSGDCIGIAHTFVKWKHPSHPLGYLIQGHGGSHNDVTHWMLLPEPPQAPNVELTGAATTQTAATLPPGVRSNDR